MPPNTTNSEILSAIMTGGGCISKETGLPR
jgi:hypothetical protein